MLRIYCTSSDALIEQRYRTLFIASFFLAYEYIAFLFSWKGRFGCNTYWQPCNNKIRRTGRSRFRIQLSLCSPWESSLLICSDRSFRDFNLPLNGNIKSSLFLFLTRCVVKVEAISIIVRNHYSNSSYNNWKTSWICFADVLNKRTFNPNLHTIINAKCCANVVYASQFRGNG